MGCKMSTGVTSPTAPEVVVVPSVRAKKFCLQRDSPDSRDLFLSVARHSKVKDAKLPSSMNLRPKEAFPVYQQGDLGSCTANAIAAAFHYEQLQQGFEGFCPSRLFIYYLEREILGTLGEDSGATLRSGMAAISKFGVCEERVWPYKESEFTSKPNEESYANAAGNTCKKYARVQQDLESLKGCIAAGYPFVFGFTVYSNFMDMEGGHMALTPGGDKLGGHAVQACGYDDATECFIVRNSWGDAWGDQGHFYMPYTYITDPELSRDFWAIKWVDDAEFPIEGDETKVQERWAALCGC